MNIKMYWSQLSNTLWIPSKHKLDTYVQILNALNSLGKLENSAHVPVKQEVKAQLGNTYLKVMFDLNSDSGIVLETLLS